MSEPIAVGAQDLPLLLALNNRNVPDVSELGIERLRHLFAERYMALRVGADDAFMLAFDQNADYDSPNFLWFKARYPRFAYVDRVMVGRNAQGRGFGRALYQKLFDRAQADGHDCVTCEVNANPPNPGSDAFHAAMGFEVVGEASVYRDDYRVRYMVRRLS